ncbi:MAG: hypothetical protein QM831_36430 [Kofleriaceae bacterium]
MDRARIELHYAAQILSACADAWLAKRDDDGHTSMIWESPFLQGETGLSLGTDLLLVHEDKSFSLVGKTLAEGMAWADAQLGRPRGAHMRDYDMPPSPLRSGATFVGYPSELARAYDAGLAAVSQFAADARVWPHHFDLGAIVDGLGIGLSPGDRYYDEPYFYVTPAHHVDRAPTLPSGFWRDDEWQGAILLLSAGGDPAEFIRTALSSLR